MSIKQVFGKFSWKILFEIFLIVIISLGFTRLFSNYVPFNMDEFLKYHVLSCEYYPLNKVPWFREACQLHELAIFPGHYWPLRSYQYIGSVQGLFYFPLFQMWPSPHSARLMGMLFLVLQAFCLSRLFKINFLLSFLGLLSFMPYVFQHVVNIGEVAIQLTSVFLICLWTRRWVEALGRGKGSWLYPSGIGLVLFLCVWVKLAYFFMLPGICLLMAYEFYAHRVTLLAHAKKRFLFAQGILVVLIAGGLIWMLLQASSRFDTKYYQVMTQTPKIPISDCNAILNHFMEKFSQYFMNPLTSVHNIFEAPEVSWSIEGIVLMGTVAAFIILSIVKIILKKMNAGFVFVSLGIFGLTLFIISLSGMTWAMHHIVLSFPFLILALFAIGSECRKDKVVWLIVSVFLVVNVSLYAGLGRLQYKEKNHPAMADLNEFLNQEFSGPYVFVILNWGMYYIKALYGNKDQCVVYIDPLSSDYDVDHLKEVLHNKQRKAVFIFRRDYGRGGMPTEVLLLKIFPNLVQAETGIDTGKWVVWHER